MYWLWEEQGPVEFTESPKPSVDFPLGCAKGGNAWVMLPLSGEDRENPASRQSTGNQLSGRLWRRKGGINRTLWTPWTAKSESVSQNLEQS